MRECSIVCRCAFHLFLYSVIFSLKGEMPNSFLIDDLIYPFRYFCAYLAVAFESCISVTISYLVATSRIFTGPTQRPTLHYIIDIIQCRVVFEDNYEFLGQTNLQGSVLVLFEGRIKTCSSLYERLLRKHLTHPRSETGLPEFTANAMHLIYM
jgi:hypothetical protein